ncbi:4'-phosphopantetheinyl transferase family protein [Streptomyces sp. NPDC056817]|uniref:4'-phosphopantetheinyl transferase family protein n=1 Tax=Streptomyces sp. NPDC056817 TaxID=3345950 RepID=UPI0036850182
MRLLHHDGTRDPTCWPETAAALHATGSVVVHTDVGSWLPAHGDGGDDPYVQRLLGRDRRRMERMPHPRSRARFAASRLFMKHAAAAVLDAAPEDLELAYKPGGRPYLRGIDQLDLSLSHTEELLVIGLTRRGRIGVDVEHSDRRMLDLGTQRQACTPHELQHLEDIPEATRNTALVRMWTLKEAYSKAIGQGLRFRFTEFGFGESPDRPGVPRLEGPDGEPVGGDEWAFHSWPAGRFTVGVALHDPGFDALSSVAPVRSTAR